MIANTPASSMSACGSDIPPSPPLRVGPGETKRRSGSHPGRPPLPNSPAWRLGQGEVERLSPSPSGAGLGSRESSAFIDT